MGMVAGVITTGGIAESMMEMKKPAL